jgi:IclR family transcriptional regulator, KDG regulon repressor
MIQSVVRAFKILETISHGDKEGMGLVEVARTLELEKSTTYNLIKTLLAQGYVAQDGSGGKYRLGSKLMDLTHGGLGDKYLQDLLMPLCKELQQRVEENVSLVAYRGGALKVICRVMCENELVVAPNNYKPLYTTITGRCLLAQVADKQLVNIVNILGLPDELWNGVKDMDVLHKELQKIRNIGKCTLDSEKRQLGGVGYIIKSPEKFTPLSIGAAMPLFRFKQKEDLLNVMFAEYAEKISILLEEAAE